MTKNPQTPHRKQSFGTRQELYQREIKITKIPKSFQGILWSANVKNLDLEKNKIYIIHQILEYGTIEQIHWLFKTYGKRTIRNIFLRYPQNIYSPPVLYFVKNIILGLKNTIVSKKQYVKTLF